MKPDIVVIGTGHRLQAGHANYSPEQIHKFCELLELTCEKYEIELIAEEMSADVLSDYGTAETIGQQVATNRGIQHRYIDLTAEERTQLGVDRLSLHKTGHSAKLSEPQFAALEQFAGELREVIWLTRILKINTWPTLFVCGACHGPRIRLLFNSVGKLAILEVNDFEPG
jgi:hypothetical protein